MEKFRMNFNIAGIPKEIEMDDIDLDLIDLDPDNPRLGYWKDIQEKDKFSQKEISSALVFEDEEGIRKLRLNIEVNEGIINPIWVIRVGERYLAIDGNTRIQIYRDLRRKYPQKPGYKSIKCRILPESTDEKAVEFIRLNEHLRGVNDWEVYVRAKMLYTLYYKRGYSYEELQNKTKLAQNQIIRWMEAYKNMNEQFLPQYGEQPDSLRKFSYFVEFENPKIKQGIDKLNLGVKDFCKWVGEGQIRRAQDVRDLKKILDSEKSKKQLVEKGYSYAVEELATVRPGFRSKLFDSIEEVISGLKNMTRLEEEEIQEEDTSARRNLLKELHKELSKIIKTLN